MLLVFASLKGFKPHLLLRIDVLFVSKSGRVFWGGLRRRDPVGPRMGEPHWAQLAGKMGKKERFGLAFCLGVGTEMRKDVPTFWRWIGAGPGPGPAPRQAQRWAGFAAGPQPQRWELGGYGLRSGAEGSSSFIAERKEQKGVGEGVLRGSMDPLEHCPLHPPAQQSRGWEWGGNCSPLLFA